MTVIIGAVGTCIGGWIKVMGVSPDRFYVALIGQSIIAVSQVFILGVPPNVAAVWFGPQQVSSACAIGVFGNQVRILLHFFFFFFFFISFPRFKSALRLSSPG